jgi:predicted Zn finger-like uncharacterized protein
MALATQCPHCGKRFRVAADQLKLRGGIVRCGACQEIFDGNATLIDLDALAAQQPASASQPPASAPAIGSKTVVPAQADTQLPAGPEAAPEPAPPEVEPAAAAPDTHEVDGQPIYTLDFDHTFDPFGILPKAEESASGPSPDEAHDPHDPGLEPTPIEHPQPEAPAATQPDQAHEHDTVAQLDTVHIDEPVDHTEPPRREPVFDAPAAATTQAHRLEPTFDLTVDEELVAAALPEPGDFEEHAATARPSLHTASAPLPMRESAPAEPLSSQPRPAARTKTAQARANRRSKLTPTRIAPPRLRVPEIDEPEFVKRSRQQEQSGKVRRILMAVGSAVLLLVLAAQGISTYRNELAAGFPATRPALLAACTVLRCRVELPARIDKLAIEQGELTALGTNMYSLATLLHNQGSLVQAWPHIELTLTDTNDKPLLRRVFKPAEYLPQGTTPAGGFGPRAEQQVKLYFQLDQLKPSGYSIAVFYP